MKLSRDRRVLDFPDLLTADINASPLSWVGDQHYRAVFRPAGDADTPILGIYPSGSPCDQSLTGMFAHAAELLAADEGPAMYHVPFSGFTDHRGMEASGQGFSNSFKFSTSWTVQGTIALMTPFGILAGGGCDKTFPMIVHTMGIEPYRYVPWALLHAGHRTVGKMPDGKEVTIGDLAVGKIRYDNGDMTLEELDTVRSRTLFDEGVCENLASAMSNYVALACGGFILAHTDLHASHAPERMAHTEKTIALFRNALQESVVPADVIGEDNFDNFIRAIALFALSTNLPLHLPWMARSWGIKLDPRTIWEKMKSLPWLTDLQPVGAYPVNHISDQLPGFIKYLVDEGMLNDVTTLFGPRLSELYADAPDMNFETQKIFRPVSDPMSPGPQVALYEGNLCPDGAWVKEGPSMRATGEYKVHRFETQADFFTGTGRGTRFESDTCYVITGDKSTIELLSANFTISVAMADDPALDIALLTDQRTSGFAGTRCKAAYHMPRERLRQLQTGNRIRFDPSTRRIDRIGDNSERLDDLMDQLAASYVEPDWPATGTLKDIINRHLSSANDGCGVV